MFGKSSKPSPIDSLIGGGTMIEGDISFTGGLRIDGHVKGNVRAIGNKPGTGGSLGVAFLKRSLFTPVFADLWAIRHAL